MTRRWLPDHVTEYKDRHGKARYRYRRTGFPAHHFTAPPGTMQFLTELAACKAMEKLAIGQDRAVPGSIDDLAVQFYRSPAWKEMRPSSQATYRGIIDRFRVSHGKKPVALIKPVHLDAILGAMSDRPAAANNLRKALKRMFKYAIKLEMRADNPAMLTDPYKQNGDGFHAWSEEEIDAYRAHHPLGTRPRLAMELLLWTDQRRSDVVRMGKQHVRDGRLHVRQQKTGKLLWIKMAPQLHAAIDAMPASDALVYLVTAQGKSFTAAGFGNWFRDQCDAAGLKGCSAHGLRKAMARRAADLGATNQQLKSVGGWSGDREVSVYTASANQRALADGVIDSVSVWEFGEPGKQNLANRD